MKKTSVWKYITKLIVGILLASVMLSLTKPSVNALSSQKGQITYETLSEMQAEEVLQALLDNGLVLPSDYSMHQELAVLFIDNYFDLILDGKINKPVFNYTQANELVKNIIETLQNMGTIRVSSPLFSRYVLVDSAPIGTWDNDYLSYNCYAYAIGYLSHGPINPGAVSYSGGTNPFSITMSIDDMASLVLQDLETLNNWGYIKTYKPNPPDQYFKVIAIRKNLNNVDYHFMKMYNGSINSWAHKPAWTQPLLWNYSSPGYKYWTNEAMGPSFAYSPTITYDSNIRYIVYKGYNDPGNQYQVIMPADLGQ